MAIDNERFEEQCAAYVLNALEGEEFREFKKALAEADPDVKRIYEEMQWTALHLPLRIDLATPPPEAKQKILGLIRRRGVSIQETLFAKLATTLGFRRPQFALGFSIAFVVLLGGLMYYTFFLREMIYQRDQQITVLRSELSSQQKRFAELREDLARKEEILKVLQSPKIDVVIMNGLEISPTGYGKIIWDPDRKAAILQISNLPPVPKDKDYQLWVIKGQKPVSAGVFSLTDPVKETFFKIDQLVEPNKKAISAFAVTLEPKGGVPQPTGKMYLLGKPS